MTQLNLLECQKGVVKLMSTTVARELISHLHDNPGDEAFSHCLFGCKCLFDHCGNSMSYNMLPLPETQDSHVFFGVENPKTISHQKAISSLLFTLSQAPELETVQNQNTIITQVIDFMNNAETVMISEMKRYCQTIDPNFSDWRLFNSDKSNRKKYLNFVRGDRFKKESALAFLLAVRDDLMKQGIPAKYPDDNIVNAYVSMYKNSLSLRRDFFEKFLSKNNLDITANRNFIWDEQIISCVGNCIGGLQIVLITDDKMMANAIAKSPNNHLNHMKYRDYMSFLGI